MLGEGGADRRAGDRRPGRDHSTGGRPDLRRGAPAGAADPAGAAPGRGVDGGGRGGGSGGGARYPPRRRPPAASSVGGTTPPTGGGAFWAVGDDVPGTVTRVLPFGAFVTLPDGTTGLVHISEVAHRFVSDLAAEVTIGDAVTVRVVSVSGSGDDFYGQGESN